MKIKQLTPFAIAVALFVVFGCDDAVQELSAQDDITAAKMIAEYAMKDGAYDTVEEQPLPVGGMAEFYGWVGQNLLYSKNARKQGIEGRVFVQFVVGATGDITDVKVLKGIEAGCDQAVADMMNKAPNWKPGKVDGKAVPVRMVLPVSFKLPPKS